MSTAMAKQRTRHEALYERAMGGGSKVDRAACIIRGVCIISKLSTDNGRVYAPSALKAAIPMYEGCRVGINHPPLDGSDTDVRSIIGWLQGVRQTPTGGLQGDLHLLATHPMTPAVLEAAERRPSLFAMSHHVSGETRREGGKTVVEKITAVRGVDLVADPASTRSLFERVGVKLASGWTFPRSASEAAVRLFSEGSASVASELGEPIDADEPGDTVADEPEVLNAIRHILQAGGSEREQVDAIKRALGLAVATDPPVAPTTVSEPAETTESIEDFRRRVNGKPSIQETKAAIRRLIR